MLNMEKVFVSEILSDLIPSFVQSRAEEFVELEKAVNEQDFERISRLGHKLKGSSLNYGFQHLGELCEEFEQAGRNRNLVAAQEIIKEMRRHLQSVEIVYVEDDEF